MNSECTKQKPVSLTQYNKTISCFCSCTFLSWTHQVTMRHNRQQCTRTSSSKMKTSSFFFLCLCLRCVWEQKTRQCIFKCSCCNQEVFCGELDMSAYIRLRASVQNKAWRGKVCNCNVSDFSQVNWHDHSPQHSESGKFLKQLVQS